MKLNISITLFLLAVTSVIAQTLKPTNRPELIFPTAEDVSAFGEWSASTLNPTNVVSLQARFLVAESPEYSGSRVVAAYLELKSKYSLNIYYDGVRCELCGADGKTVISPLAFHWGISSGAISAGYWLTLPQDSILRFRLSQGYTTKSTNTLDIEAGGNNWSVPTEGTNDCFYLSGTLNLAVNSLTGKNETNALTQFITLKLPPVKISAKNLVGK